MKVTLSIDDDVNFIQTNPSICIPNSDHCQVVVDNRFLVRMVGVFIIIDDLIKQRIDHTFKHIVDVSRIETLESWPGIIVAHSSTLGIIGVHNIKHRISYYKTRQEDLASATNPLLYMPYIIYTCIENIKEIVFFNVITQHETVKKIDDLEYWRHCREQRLLFCDEIACFVATTNGAIYDLMSNEHEKRIMAVNPLCYKIISATRDVEDKTYGDKGRICVTLVKRSLFCFELHGIVSACCPSVEFNGITEVTTNSPMDVKTTGEEMEI